jgi:hypothetical protein
LSAAAGELIRYAHKKITKRSEFDMQFKIKGTDIITYMENTVTEIDRIKEMLSAYV